MAPLDGLAILAFTGGSWWGVFSAMATALRHPRASEAEDVTASTVGASLELQVTPERQFAMKVVLSLGYS